MSKLPNILTISRIVLLPVLIILIFSDSNLINFLSIVLFIVMSITDYLDGLIARKTKNTSNFGKMLDPIADKLFVVLILITFISDNMLLGIHLIPAYLIIAREVFISGLREYASSDDNKKEIPVSNLGKYKTAAQMSSLFLILLADVYSSLLLINNFGIALLWIAMIASVYSGYQYYRKIF